jgi:hypothetical protein
MARPLVPANRWTELIPLERDVATLEERIPAQLDLAGRLPPGSHAVAEGEALLWVLQRAREVSWRVERSSCAVYRTKPRARQLRANKRHPASRDANPAERLQETLDRK